LNFIIGQEREKYPKPLEKGAASKKPEPHKKIRPCNTVKGAL
jgi:hypothetical protein